MLESIYLSNEGPEHGEIGGSGDLLATVLIYF